MNRVVGNHRKSNEGIEYVWKGGDRWKLSDRRAIVATLFLFVSSHERPIYKFGISFHRRRRRTQAPLDRCRLLPFSPSSFCLYWIQVATTSFFLWGLSSLSLSFFLQKTMIVLFFLFFQRREEIGEGFLFQILVQISRENNECVFVCGSRLSVQKKGE